MINPEKLLGGMLMGNSRSIVPGIGGSIGLGLLGVAMEAVEHYMKQKPPIPPAGSGQSAVPPPPPGTEGRPPSPGAPAAPPPPPPPAASASSAAEQNTEGAKRDALLLLRAMIAAANADGVIDAEERARILERLNSVDPTPEERAFMAEELLSPVGMETIVDRVESPEMAEQVYAASLMAITVDTPAEHRYMAELARRLGLDETAVSRICRNLGVEHP